MGADLQSRYLDGGEAEPRADVLIHFKGGPTPLYLGSLPEKQAWKIRNDLTPDVEPLMVSPWYDIPHYSKHHRLKVADVCYVTVTTVLMPPAPPVSGVDLPEEYPDPWAGRS